MRIDISEISKNPKKLVLFAMICALLGAVWFVMVRAVLIDASGPHFHANFALYFGDEKEAFEEGIYYEEVASCGSDVIDPKTRVHLHDFVSDVVHVHDVRATWGNFFENLGFTLGNNVLYAHTNTYVDGEAGKLVFMLNGKVVQSIANRPIESEDTLLIYYGDATSDVLDARYQQIVQSAAEYNQKADPSACSGSQTVGYWDRIKLVLGVE